MSEFKKEDVRAMQNSNKIHQSIEKCRIVFGQCWREWITSGEILEKDSIDFAQNL